MESLRGSRQYRARSHLTGGRHHLITQSDIYGSSALDLPQLRRHGRAFLNTQKPPPPDIILQKFRVHPHKKLWMRHLRAARASHMQTPSVPLSHQSSNLVP
jgi:hypothetical protein